jgi:hypothetical protein
MLKYKIQIKLFVLNGVFICCDTVQTEVGGYAVCNTTNVCICICTWRSYHYESSEDGHETFK